MGVVAFPETGGLHNKTHHKPLMSSDAEGPFHCSGWLVDWGKCQSGWQARTWKHMLGLQDSHGHVHPECCAASYLLARIRGPVPGTAVPLPAC